MSRKKQVNQKITALYCRISLDDGGDNESMSISNQKLMLKEFAEKNGMFQYEYYVDDGYTGRNFNRPAFQRMIADIEAGKIGCVITKDLSRLGRNYIEAGSYIEIFFPKHNVRYIAITDGVDSLTRQEMDITPFKNGSKCILQLRGVRPFLSDKFDITKHKRYKELSDFDEKNAFDVERYLKHELRLRMDEEFDCYEVDMTPTTDD